MKKKNEDGFVLLETVIVAVFVISIFTFVYMAVVPLIGRYEELYNNYELEKTYELYHIRDAIYKDSNFLGIINNEYGVINASDFSDQNYYDALTKKIFNDDDYKIVYIKNIDDNLNSSLNNMNIKDSFKEYIKKIKEDYASEDFQNIIFLRDGKRFSYLGLAINLNDITNYS